MATNNKGGYTTKLGLACTNIISYSTHCSAGHPASAFPLGDISPNVQSDLDSESPTIDSEDLFADSPDMVMIEMPNEVMLQISSGVIDENSILAFSRGQCHSLAISLAQRLGVEPTILVFNEYDNEGWEDGDLDEDDEYLAENWHHAAIYLGENKFLDIKGVRSGEEIIEEFGYHYPEGAIADGAYEFINITSSRLGSLWRFDETGAAAPPAMAVAEKFVDSVLALRD